MGRIITFALLGAILVARQTIATEYIIEANSIDGNDEGSFQAECLDKVEPGDTCTLKGGDYYTWGYTRTHGTADKRITIQGDSDACIKGHKENDKDRMFQVAHDYYTIKDICFDGSGHSESTQPSTAIYVLTDETPSEKNGVKSGVTGLELINLHIRNFREECIHLKCFTTYTRIEGCTVSNCGQHDFVDYPGSGSKVGEGVYIGTSVSQWSDGKCAGNNGKPDVCQLNWIHHNDFFTYGNECVDIKEGSTYNLIENNICEKQKDPNSGGFDSRGDGNFFRYNVIEDVVGAGIRYGGHHDYGKNNHAYGNTIGDADNGAFVIKHLTQGQVCGNTVSGAVMVTGEAKFSADFNGENSPDEDCAGSLEGDIDGFESYNNGAGVNYATTFTDSMMSMVSPTPSPASEPTPSPFHTSSSSTPAPSVSGSDSTTENSVSTVLLPASGCDNLAAVETIVAEHSCSRCMPLENLYDSDPDTYWSVNRTHTTLEYQLKSEEEVTGVSLRFYKGDLEHRIQKFSITVGDGDDEVTAISKKEKAEHTTDHQLYSFESPRSGSVVRFKSYGNQVNEWTSLLAFDVCTSGGTVVTGNSVNSGLAVGTTNVCSSPWKLRPQTMKSQGGLGDVISLTDGNFDTRWSTNNTANAVPAQNDYVTFIFDGDVRLFQVDIAFFDGDLAAQSFSVYTMKAADTVWSEVLVGATAATSAQLQSFMLNVDAANRLIIVGGGNTVGSFSKFAEVEIYGC